MQVRTIAGLMLAETVSRVAEKGYNLEIGATLMERIIQDGYSHEYGVRPLRQVSLGCPGTFIRHTVQTLL